MVHIYTCRCNRDRVKAVLAPGRRVQVFRRIQEARDKTGGQGGLYASAVLIDRKTTTAKTIFKKKEKLSGNCQFTPIGLWKEAWLV